MCAKITFKIISDCIIYLDAYPLLSLLKCSSEWTSTSKIVRDVVSRERFYAEGGEGQKNV